MTVELVRDPVDILIVDDDDELRDEMVRYFSRRGFHVSDAARGEDALAMLQMRAFDVILLDMMMPGISGLDLLSKIREHEICAEVVILTGQGTIETAVEAMKLGAREFLAKPIRLKDLECLIQKACESRQLRKENQQFRAVIKQQQLDVPAMIGSSPPMQEVCRLIQRLGASAQPILIQGESGTGKELVARALHRVSPLAENPLVVINCAALPATLLESELFGHEKGSFTGAVAMKQGLFEVADGGTLFIDEMGELEGSLQAKLLRVLEDGSMRRVGSVKERRVKVRLIAATNRDLQKEVREGRFREDLYYRINVLTITLPPLRDREGDIPALVRHFLGNTWQIDDDVIPILERYSWPGNVRQLQNAIERAKVLADDDRISSVNLPPEIVQQSRESPQVITGGKFDLEAVNRTHVEQVYQRNQRNKARTARALGIGRRTLYRLLEKYGIVDDSNSSPDGDVRVVS
ncbi:MAG: sigma-54 dependent transcriptional regulator [Planctomycetota bacterium]|nr:sigma-54 dependent transcriptional regulator [Planctomycetota bacterium]MDA1177171.1 sigma-54 dependent transcriptional regulator [Planctomycetota bacterium]